MRPSDAPALLRLRPRDVPGLFDQAVWLYRRNFRVFLGIAALVYLPVTVMMSFITAWLFDPLTSLINAFPQAGDTEVSDAYINAITDLTARTSISSLLSLVGSVLLVMAEGALARAIADRFLGRPVTVMGAYRAIRPHLGWLIVFIFIQGIASYLIFLPPLFLYVIVAWSFVTQVIVLENANVVTAIQRSWRLVQGQWWRTLGMNALLLVIGTVIALPAGVISGALLLVGTPGSLIGFVVQFATLSLNLVFLPARLAALTLMYYDLRIRKEAYDLEVAVAEQQATIGPPLISGTTVAPPAPLAVAPSQQG